MSEMRTLTSEKERQGNSSRSAVTVFEALTNGLVPSATREQRYSMSVTEVRGRGKGAAPRESDTPANGTDVC